MCNKKYYSYNSPRLRNNIPITCKGDLFMAKAGMRRPDPKAPHGTENTEKMNIPKNEMKPVPELQGKAKKTKEQAKPFREK